MINNNSKLLLNEKINTVLIDKIIDLGKFLKNKFDDVDNDIIKRQRILHFKDVIYYLITKIGNNRSYNINNSLFKLSNICDVTTQAFIDFRKKIDPNIILKLIDQTYSHYFPKNNEPRYISVDGSQINLSRKLKEDYKLNPDGAYCTALLSCLFDITNNTPINYKLTNDKNERTALIDQLGYVNKKDVLVMDRGYFSNNLLNILHTKEIGYIFRLRKSSAMVRKLGKQFDMTYDYTFTSNNVKEKIKVRIIKYVINNDEYYLCTSVFDKPIEFLKKMYWNRWGIETHFRKTKYFTSMGDINSFSKKFILQEIYSVNFMFLVESYILNLKKCKDQYMVNHKNAHNIIINNLLYDLFYNSHSPENKTNIGNITKVIYDCIFKKQPNRSNKRIRKKPLSKWGRHGNRFGDCISKKQKKCRGAFRLNLNLKMGKRK